MAPGPATSLPCFVVGAECDGWKSRAVGGTAGELERNLDNFVHILMPAAAVTEKREKKRKPLKKTKSK